MLRRSSFKSDRASAMRGFTLIEVLVAISLLAIVLTSVYGVFAAVSTTNDRLQSDSAEYHLARVIFDRLGRELHGVYYRSGDQTTRLRGGKDDSGSPFLELTTTAVTPLSTAGTGIAEIRYRLVRDLEADDGRSVLLRAERPRQTAPAGAEEERMMRLAPGLVDMLVRFYRGGNWQNQWDAEQDGLPQMVEITLVTGRDPQRQVTFRSAFELPEVTLR